jgi:general secretion pathway protein G
LDVFLAVAIAAVLACIAIPSYQSYVQRTNVTVATRDIMNISQVIGRYYTVHSMVPPDLATIGFDTQLDPWGHAYVYQSFDGLTGKGKMRKDKNLNPLNTQYDLYSMGADGQSKMPITAPESQDDIILAFDGNYIGLASNF